MEKGLSMYILQFVYLTAALSLCASCSSMKVTTHHKQGADFKKLTAYAWQKGHRTHEADLRIESAVLEDRVMKAVDEALAKKGFQMVEKEAADFLVLYNADLETRMDVKVIDAHGSDLLEEGDFEGWSTMDPEEVERVYEEGTLVIDFVDPETLAPLWTGTVRAEINVRASREKKDKKIARAVGRVMSRFPPSSI
jgi:hypothetical protein